MSDAAFDRLMTAIDPPMTVVTTVAGEERAGCLVGFHSQAGMDPDKLAVWISKANHTFRVAGLADHFAVHFLDQRNRDLARLFGTTSGDTTDKFARCSWHEGDGGVPVLDGCDHVVVGRKVALLETEADHVCIVIDPSATTHAGPFAALRLSAVVDLDPGHDPNDRPGG